MLCCILLLAPASLENIVHGQNGFLTAALLAGGLRLLAPRPVWAGILFGILTIKPQLGLLVPLALIAGRHWRALVAAAATTGVLVVLSILVFGVSPWLNFFQFHHPSQGPDIQSISSLLEGSLVWNAQFLMPTPFMALRILGASLNTAYAGMAFFSISAGAAVIYAFMKTASEDLRSSIVLTGTLLATPYALSYDMTLTSAAVISIIFFACRKPLSAGVMAMLFIVWSLPMFILLTNHHGLPVTPFILSAFLAMQVYWVYEERKGQRLGFPGSGRCCGEGQRL